MGPQVKYNPKTLSVWEEDIKDDIWTNQKERWELENQNEYGIG